MQTENLSEMKVLREAVKIFKRKIPGFREKLTIEEIRENPFICIMIQTALSRGTPTEEEMFIIRKVTRAYYSFVDGKLIDEVLPKAVECEKEDPTPLDNLIKQVKLKASKRRDKKEYDYKLYLLTFAYVTVYEDGSHKIKEEFVQKLVDKLSITKKEQKRLINLVKEDYTPNGKKRTGNIVRNIISIGEKEREEFKGSKLKALIEMFDFIKGYKTIYIISMIFLAVMSVIQIINPMIVRYIVDKILIIPTANYESLTGDTGDIFATFIKALIGLALLGLGLRAIGVVSRFLSTKLTVKSSHSASRDIKDKVYRHLTHLPYSYFDKNKTGEIISICTSDINSVTRTFSTINAQLVRIIVTFIPAFSIMLYLNWKLALVSVATFPIIILLSMFFFQKESTAYESYQEQEARMSAVLQENLNGVRVVKAFARQKFEEDKFEAENQAKFKEGKRLIGIHALFWPITDVLSTIQIALSLIVGSYMTLNGEISLGTIIAFIQYLFNITWPMKILGRMTVELVKSAISWKRINLILKSPAERIDEGIKSDEKLKGSIEFKNVSFSYEEGQPIINDLNLKINAGEKVALIGHTGCGKSTIINLLSGFYPIGKGEVIVDGVNINDYAKTYLNDQIGLIHQEAFLFSKTIKENVAFARKNATDEHVYDACKKSDIHESILSFPDGYETKVGEKGVTLSGGQKQRVTIARTILKDPAILILDDSLSAVDTETEERIQSAMDEVMKGRTSIIIGHRITSIMKADKIVVLENGEIVQQGTHKELIKVEGIYKSIFDIQSKIEEEIEKEVTV
jgi:ATP-binding cassette, subfamily B, bacterial